MLVALKFWNAYKDYLIDRYGFPVYRIGVDGGFSCPNRSADRKGGCVFCDSLGASAVYARSKESGFTRRSGFETSPPQTDSVFAGLSLQQRMESVRKQIERGKEFIRRRYGSNEVSLYYQAYSNTYGPLDEMEALFRDSISHGPFYELIVSTRPDCLGDDVLKRLCLLKNETIDVSLEMGLQSGSDRILGLMNRGHSVGCWKDSVNRASDKGLRVCSHVILGFPSETRTDIDMTIKAVNSSPVSALKIHNLHITSQSRLLFDYFGGEITASSTARYLQSVVYFLRRIRPDIVIERLMCETPAHRLAAPRSFPDKTGFLMELERMMNQANAVQGDMYC